MKLKPVPAALFLCAALAPLPAASQDAKEEKKAAKTESKQDAKPAKKAPAKMPSQEEMMKVWTEVGTPGPMHKKLEGMVGTWTTHVKAWMAPGAPAMESDGTAEMASVLGGRFIEEKFHGTMMGQPFEGIGYNGYDNYKKKAVGVWMDNMSTMVMTTTGTWDAAGKSLTSTGTMDDPVMKKTTKVKAVATWGDDDHMTFEMWGQAPDGKMFKTLEIAYTRKK